MYTKEENMDMLSFYFSGDSLRTVWDLYSGKYPDEGCKIGCL